MRIFNNGYFALMLEREDLAKGLKPKGSVGRNEKFLENLGGGFVHDGELQSLDLLDRTNTDIREEVGIVVFTFPWPQLLVRPNRILLCGPTTIYELVGTSWAFRIAASLEGGFWACVDFEDYFYLSNGKVVITRSTGGTWAEVTTLPKAMALCNFNGQVFAGSVEV